MQSRNSPFFFLMKSIGAPWGEFEGLMKLLLRFSSMKTRRASNSIGDREYMHPGGGEVPSSNLIFRS